MAIDENKNVILSETKQLWLFTTIGSGQTLSQTVEGSTYVLNKTVSTETALTVIETPSSTKGFNFTFGAKNDGSFYTIDRGDYSLIARDNTIYGTDEDYQYIWFFEEYKSPKYTISINETPYSGEFETGYTYGATFTYGDIKVPEFVTRINKEYTFTVDGQQKTLTDAFDANAQNIVLNVSPAVKTINNNTESKVVYRFLNPFTGEYLYDNGSTLQATTMVDEHAMDRLFEFDGNGNSYTLKNVGTGTFVTNMGLAGVTTGQSSTSYLINATPKNKLGLWEFTNSNTALVVTGGKVIGRTAGTEASSWVLEEVEDNRITVKATILLPGATEATEILNLTTIPGYNYTLTLTDSHINELLSHYSYQVKVGDNIVDKTFGQTIENISKDITIAIEFTGLKDEAPVTNAYYSIFNASDSKNSSFLTQSVKDASLTATAATGTYAQVWKLTADNKLQNVLTQQYITAVDANGIQMGEEQNATTFTITKEDKNIYGFAIEANNFYLNSNGSNLAVSKEATYTWLFIANTDINDNTIEGMRAYQSIISLPTQLNYFKTATITGIAGGFTGNTNALTDGSNTTFIENTNPSNVPTIQFAFDTKVEMCYVTFVTNASETHPVEYAISVNNSPLQTVSTTTANVKSELLHDVQQITITFSSNQALTVYEARVNGITNTGNIPEELGQTVIENASVAGTYENKDFTSEQVTTLTSAVNAAIAFPTTFNAFKQQFDRVSTYITKDYTIGSAVGEYTDPNKNLEEIKTAYNQYNSPKYLNISEQVTVKEYTDATEKLGSSVKPTINMPVNGKAYKLSPASNLDIAATLNHGLPMKNSSDDESNMIFCYKDNTLQAIGNGEKLTLGATSELTFTESPAKLGAFTINAGDYYMYKAATSWAAQQTSEIVNGLENPITAWVLTEVKEHTVSLREVDATQAWATFFSSKRCYLPEGVIARYVSSGAEFVKVPGKEGSYYISFVDIEGKILPAATGVILKSATAGDITIYEGDVTTDSTTLENNAFFGFDEDTTVSESQSALALGMVDGVAGFYTFAGDTYWMNKAFLSKNKLNIPTSSAANVSLIWNQSTPTGIDQTVASDTETEDNAYYDLSGKRYDSKPTKAGIYIKNRKKIIIK